MPRIKKIAFVSTAQVGTLVETRQGRKTLIDNLARQLFYDSEQVCCADRCADCHPADMDDEALSAIVENIAQVRRSVGWEKQIQTRNAVFRKSILWRDSHQCVMTAACDMTVCSKRPT